MHAVLEKPESVSADRKAKRVEKGELSISACDAVCGILKQQYVRDQEGKSSMGTEKVESNVHDWMVDLLEECSVVYWYLTNVSSFFSFLLICHSSLLSKKSYPFTMLGYDDVIELPAELHIFLHIYINYQGLQSNATKPHWCFTINIVE